MLISTLITTIESNRRISWG